MLLEVFRRVERDGFLLLNGVTKFGKRGEVLGERG